MNSKVAIITGAGSGIGRDFAIALLKKGYQVALAGRRLEPLQESLKLAGERVEGICVSTDVSQPDSVKHLFAETQIAYGRLDLLFNNAGVSAPGVLFEDLSFEQWKSVVDINLTGMFLCSQEAFKLMKTQNPMGGRIINNGSISAHVPRPNSAPYTATKHAVTGLTRSCGLDGRKYNIAVGQIDIGNALTPMAKKMQKGVPQADGEIKIEPTMDVNNVTETLLYMAELPPEANVPFLTVMATKMPYIGRG
ncbi:MAG: SDR family oxidoreductase [Bacteroidia bacterium]|nr:SDR family oxidoreductase [Bacteroidia bacterium]